VLVGHKGALWLEAVTTGVTAHGSMPGKGVNAVYKAARAIAALQDSRVTLLVLAMSPRPRHILPMRQC
jgi:acetylornithine deacetylase/succinyl-diaminopimelate desuccinylase-like protein